MIESRFTESTQQVFRHLVLDGAEADSVARETGLSLNAVFTAKSRVLRELRRLGQGFGDASNGQVSPVLSRSCGDPPCGDPHASSAGVCSVPAVTGLSDLARQPASQRKNASRSADNRVLRDFLT
jgi:hypothetical protein